MAEAPAGGHPYPSINTKAVLDVVELETERLKLRVVQSLSVLQDEAYRSMQATLASEQAEMRADAKKSSERVKSLEHKVSAQAKGLQDAMSKLLNLAGKAGYRYKLVEGARLANTVFRQWNRYVQLEKRERRYEQLPGKHYGKVLLRKVVCGWRSSARTDRAARTDTYWRGKCDEARTDAAVETREQLEALTLQLQQAREQIHIGAEQRDALEDELKRAFMRGVCALNMEAVSILRHGSAGTRRAARRSPRTAPAHLALCFASCVALARAPRPHSVRSRPRVTSAHVTHVIVTSACPLTRAPRARPLRLRLRVASVCAQPRSVRTRLPAAKRPTLRSCAHCRYARESRESRFRPRYHRRSPACARAASVRAHAARGLRRPRGVRTRRRKRARPCSS
jgi:hypothetical protein